MGEMITKLQFYLQYPFVWYALIVGTLIALCSSLIGVTLVLKRYSFIGDGLSHVAFGAMAVATVFHLANDTVFVMPVTIIAAVLLLRSGQNAKIKGVAAIAMLLVCIKYVNLQSANMSHAKKISAMEEELATLKEENTTRYNAIVDSVNLDEVRKKAKKDLGMVDASDSQVVEYKKPSLDYVKQYESIPKEGALTKVQTKKSK